MKSLSSKTYQCGVTIQGLTTLSGTVYLTGITNTASWDHVIVGTTAQGQIYTRTYAQFMGDVATGISLSSYVTGSGTTNYLPKFTGASALGNSQIFDNGTNVGIGTASPSAKLHLSGSGVTELRIASTTGNTNSLLSFYESTLASWGIDAGQANGSFFIKDLYNSATRLTINYLGNVGIGTTSPSQKLHVSAGNFLISGTAIGNGADANSGLRIVAPISTTHYNWMLGAQQNINSAFEITPSTTVGGTTFSTPTAVFLQNGNVGIGTSSPSSRLAILNSGASDSIITEYRMTNGSNAATFRTDDNVIFGIHAQNSGDIYIKDTSDNVLFYGKNGGNVGIGTSSPNVTLEANGIIRSDRVGVASQYVQINGGDATGPFITAAGAAKVLTIQNNSTTSSDIYFDQAVASTYQFKQATVTKMILDASGNVGIGTTSPSIIGTGIISLDIQGSSAGGLAFGPSGIKNYIYGASTMYIEANTTASFSTSGTEKMRITSGGSLLIGDTTQGYNPQTHGYLFGVKSNTTQAFISIAKSGQTLDTSGMVVGLDTTTGYVWMRESTDLTFGTNNTTRVTIAAGGNVGIGTTSPAVRLNVVGANSAEGQLYVGNTDVSYTAGINFTTSGTNRGFVGWRHAYSTAPFNLTGIHLFNTDNSNIVFGTNNLVRAVIDTNGNVGIGTTSPTAPLDTNGVRIGRNWAIADRANIRLDSNGTANPADILFGHTSAANQISWDGVYWSLSSRGSSLSNAFTIWRGAGNPGGAGEEILFTILPNGNIGIGTTAPSYKLDVAGDIRAGGADPLLILQPNSGTYVFFQKLSASNGNYLRLYDGTNYSMFWKDEKVGIGTSSPSAKFQIVSSGLGDGGGIRITNSGAGGEDYRIWPTATVNGEGAGKLIFTNNGGNVLTLTTGGNVGIGTLTPSTKLDVSGVITATGGNSTNWNTAYGWGNHASASYVPQARTLTINGTSYDLSANRTWTIATSANIQEAANNGKVTTAASVGTTVITTVATATYDGATFNYVLKDGTNYRAGTIIAVWSAGAVQFNETTTNDIGSTVGVTFTVALNAGNAELRATSATSGWTVKVVTIGI